MKYLFFDTECSNCYGGVHKICEYGQIVTDEEFNILEGSEKDIVMNPGPDGKFNLKGRDGRPDLVLSHDYGEYYRAFEFERYYDYIELMLTKKDTMVFLWAASNDVNIIIDSCRRYDLKEIDFACYDVQTMFMVVMNEDRRPSLEKAMELLELPMDIYTAHNPTDDSKMTMAVLKALCEKASKTPLELVELVRDKEGVIDSSVKWRYEMDNRPIGFGKGMKQPKRRHSYLDDELHHLYSPDEEEVPLEKRFTITPMLRFYVEDGLDAARAGVKAGLSLRHNFEVKYLVVLNDEDIEQTSSKYDISALTVINIDDFIDMVESPDFGKEEKTE